LRLVGRAMLLGKVGYMGVMGPWVWYNMVGRC